MPIAPNRARGVLALIALAVLAASAALSCSAQAGATNNPYKQPITTLSGNTTSYFDLPIGKLKETVPGLRGIRYDGSQEQLTAILVRIAQAIDGVVPRLPNLISRENIYGFQAPQGQEFGDGPASQQPWSREFKYLILRRQNADGSPYLEELRVDSKGHPVQAGESWSSPRGYGFAYQWLFFSSANQRQFHFRYLGEQEKSGHKTYAICFAQDPARVAHPAEFQAAGKTAAFYYQGILWVDQSSFDIVALRTDLLAPVQALNLLELTTELSFRSVPIRGYNAVFWLPSEVDITSNQGAGAIQENHRYSDYHLFHAETRIETAPLPQ
jgi:hypothetical protein